jgi:hypothetical protein
VSRHSFPIEDHDHVDEIRCRLLGPGRADLGGIGSVIDPRPHDRIRLRFVLRARGAVLQSAADGEADENVAGLLLPGLALLLPGFTVLRRPVVLLPGFALLLSGFTML